MIAKDLSELVGNTPMLELNRYKKGKLKARVLVKLEYFNPLSSIKDRVAKLMIERGEATGAIKKNTVIIEPTSGNTGVGLAFVCAIKGYRCVLTMPENMSIERRKLLKQLGAEVVLTKASEGMKGASDKAIALAKTFESAYIPMQFENPANADAHRDGTAEEIWRDTEGNVDIFVAGVGSGGTITGNGETLKAKKADLKVVAVEPSTSPVLSKGYSGPHGIQGIGANFIPKVLNVGIIDEIFPVCTEDAVSTAKELALSEGLLVGISSGAAVYAAVEIAKREENVGKTIVAICADTGERYISSVLFD